MKKILIAAVAVATIAGAAGAASAQPYGAHRPGYGGGYGHGGGYGSNAINAKQSALTVRIARAQRTGRLTHREARMLRSELAQVAYLEHRFRVTRGLDRREYAILNARLDRLEYRVVAEMRDGRRYGQGYGRNYGRRY